MKKLLALCLLLFSSCSIIQDNNQLQGRVRLNLLFPFELLGISEIFQLPHVEFDLSGGIEWHSDEEQHKFELDKLKLEKELELLREQKNEKTLFDDMSGFIRKRTAELLNDKENSQGRK